MNVQNALALASQRPFDVEALQQLAQAAIAEGGEEDALSLIQRALEKNPSARLWQWKGLLERSLDKLERAIASFDEAARLDPMDATIAHGQARVAMEAGVDARSLYERALSLQPHNGALLIGLAAARAAVGESERGAEDLRQAVKRSPMWLQGHEQLAQLEATLGRRDQATASLDAAIATHAKALPLWETLLQVQLRRGAYGSLKEIVERAEKAGVHSAEFAVYRGIHAAQFDEDIFPHDLFDGAPSSAMQSLAGWRIRHLLRVGAAREALPYVDSALRQGETGEIWAYASTVWRLTNDPRSTWLEGDPRLVSVIDLSDRLPHLDNLASALRALHVAKGEYLDQSVRGGTQTDGPLLSRIDPIIRELRQAIVGAVDRHVAQLPPIDPRHPTLRHRRDRPVRFSGSWSVRLRPRGHHSNHMHPLGWISSALYVDLPRRAQDEPEDSGWLTLGEPDEQLGVNLQPWRKIEPKIGQLVLFPSFMWHGTVPFSQGERLTIAFDVAPPR